MLNRWFMDNQIPPNSEALDLVLLDIELPVSPSFDWLSLLQTSAYWFVIVLSVFALMMLFVMFKARHQPFTKQSVLLHIFMARRQWSQLQRCAINSENQPGISKAEISGFYHLAQRLIYLSKVLKVQDKQAIELLQRQMNVAVFSEQAVSRETFAMNLHEVNTFLQNYLSIKHLWNYYINCLKSPFKGGV